jgi:16S rRNA (cytosine967-C5)-methyltransferase
VTPAARASAVVELLEAVDRATEPAERVLAAWSRANRYAGSGDRAAIGDLLFDCLRRRRSLAWRAGGDGPRATVIGALADRGADPAALFDGRGHAPAPLSAAERAALAAPPPPASDPVRLDYPDWLDGALRLSLGDGFEASLEALRRRAPVDLRANALRTTRAAAQAALAAEGVATDPVALAPHALRAPPGAPVGRTTAYAEGLVELQDAASQAVAAFADARPGETVLDFCAGGGGKTLALAAAMAGGGRLIAHDANPRRMSDLPARLARAQARAEIVGPDALASLAGRCDLVLVDAPCSGSGAWRRDPAAKWRLTPARLAELVALQRAILVRAARCVRPGGRLVYATCSVLAAENAEQARAWPGGAVEHLAILPDAGADGFFAARLRADRIPRQTEAAASPPQCAGIRIA